MEIGDHTVIISSNHDGSTTPGQVDEVAHEQQTSSVLMVSRSIGCTGTVAIDNPNQQPYFRTMVTCLGTAIIIFIMLVVVILFLIVSPLAMVLLSIIIPVMIICLLIYWMTSLGQFAKYEDYADIDDVYDTELGSFWHTLVLWMIGLTGTLIAELLVYLTLFRFGPSPLRKLSLLHLPIWKWFLIGIICLIYFSLWCLTRLSVHKAREWLSSKRVFLRVHVFPIYEAFLGVTVWLFYFWVESFVFKLVPPLKRPKILGLYAHNWVHALVYVFIGVNVSRFLSASIVAILQKHHQYHGKFDSKLEDKREQSEVNKCKHFYKIISEGRKLIIKSGFKNFDPNTWTIYIVVGLRRSINFVFVSIWLLVTWTSHFTHQLKPSKDTIWVLRVGTASLTCLLICAILWLVKSSIMLWWKYRSMYSTFCDQLMEAGNKLYLLNQICGQQHLDILRVRWIYNDNSYYKEDEAAEEENKKIKKKKQVEKKIKQKRIDRVVAKARTILVHDQDKADHEKGKLPKPGIYAFMRMVKYFVQAEDPFSSQNTSMDKLLKIWHDAHDNITDRTPLKRDHITTSFENHFTDDDFESLRKEIKEENEPMEEIYLEHFEGWMKRSYTCCFNRVNKLASAQRLANCLDQVMTAAIILITLGIWLCMVTSGTQTVALLAAPLLALNFMFGDTCSTIFKGIIFSYAIHPYDIGDLCIIKDTLYEVKQIDFWGTTFLKVDTNEEVFYPNSSLFDESIINKRIKKGDLALDRIEFSLESDTDRKKIKILREKIDVLKKNIDKFVKDSNGQLQKQQIEEKYDIGKPINVTVYFGHNLKDLRSELNYERLQVMKEKKQNLQLRIMEWCAEMNIKLAMGKSG